MKLGKEKNVFITLVVAIVLSICVMTGLVFTSFYRSMIDEVDTVGANALSSAVSNVDAYLQQRSNVLDMTALATEHLLKSGASSDSIESYLTYVTNELMQGIEPNTTGVYGYLNGKYVDGSDWVPDADYVPTERDWYVAAKAANGEVVIIPPYVDAQTNEVIISVCKLLSDNKSVLSYDIVLNKVQSIAKDSKINDMGYSFIVDENGLVIAHGTKLEEIGKDYATDNLMGAVLSQAKKESSFQITLDGKSNHIFTGTTSNGWTVVTVITQSSLYSAISQIFRNALIIVLIVVVLIIILSIYAYKRIQSALEDLNEESRKLETSESNLVHSKKVASELAYTDIMSGLDNRFKLQEDIANVYRSKDITAFYYAIVNKSDILSVSSYERFDKFICYLSERLKALAGTLGKSYRISETEFCVVVDNAESGLNENQLTEIFNQLRNEFLQSYGVQKINVSAAVIAGKSTFDSNPLLSIDTFMRNLEVSAKN